LSVGNLSMNEKKNPITPTTPIGQPILPLQPGRRAESRPASLCALFTVYTV
jgi:hypothetical protein